MPSHSIVQSVLLRRSAFKTVDEAKDWITEHGYKYTLPDVTPTYYRFRQHDPAPLALTHRLRTTQLGEPDAGSPMGSVGALIIAYPKTSSPMAPAGPAAAGGGAPPPAITDLKKGDVVRVQKEDMYVLYRTTKTAVLVEGVLSANKKQFRRVGDKKYTFRGKVNPLGQPVSQGAGAYVLKKVVARNVELVGNTESESETESE